MRVDKETGKQVNKCFSILVYLFPCLLVYLDFNGRCDEQPNAIGDNRFAEADNGHLQSTGDPRAAGDDGFGRANGKVR